jgi:ribosomal protein S18 acetylase RimI-like enzyme
MCNLDDQYPVRMAYFRSMDVKRIDGTESHLVIPLFDRYRVFYKQPSDPDLARRFIQARLDHNESTIFVAIEGNAAVGFVQLYPLFSSVSAARNWILNDLFVEPAFRRHRIGGALIQAALNFARETGGKFVELETGADNAIAQEIYERIGFARRMPDTGFFLYRVDLMNG